MTTYMDKQTGASLIVSLIMLLLLTIIGLSAMQGTVMQEKMVGNMRDTHTSFHAAEIALDYSELWIQDQREKMPFYGFPCNPGPCEVFDADVTASNLLSTNAADVQAWMNSATEYGNEALDGGRPREATDIAGVARQPEMLIEYFDFKEDSYETCTTNSCPGDYKFRHTIQAVGSNINSETIIQTVFVKRFN